LPNPWGRLRRLGDWAILGRVAGLCLGAGVALGLLATLLTTLPTTRALAGDDAANSALLIVDANSGRVLRQSAADAPRHPASLAKLMTLYLVFERIEAGRLTYRTRIRMSANAVAAAPSKLDIEEGAEIALIDAIKVLITKSANDVAIAIAEHMVGSEAIFAQLMTRKARELGMSATTFRNASGLPDDEQVTTARDMLTLAMHLEDDFPTHYGLFATRSFTYSGETFRNHNSLLFHFPGTDGLKTGYTHASGFNLVASVRRGRKHLIGVAFGGASAAERDRAMQGYLTRALGEASSVRSRVAAPLALARKRRGSAASVAFVPVPQRAVRRTDAPAVAARPADAVRPAGNVEVAPAAVEFRAVPAPLAPTSQAPSPPALATAPARDEGALPPSSPAASTPPAPQVTVVRVRQLHVGEQLQVPQPPAAGEPASIESLLAQARAPISDGPGQGQRESQFPVATPAIVAAKPGPDMRSSAAAGGDFASLGSRHWPTEVAPAEAPPGTPAGTEPAPATLAKTAPSPGAASVGAFQIQIGAYQSEAEALRQLAFAKTRLPQLLDNRAPVTQQVKLGERMMFRARYAGFRAEAGAGDACQALKKLKIDCLVIKGP
jgi:D-alanyl-D-alanine carboxypeptidase